MTYAGKKISVDALAERIDTAKRRIDNDTYYIRTKKLRISQLGDVNLVIAEKEAKDEENPVKYFVTNKRSVPTECGGVLRRSSRTRGRISA